jgi:nucleotide-binding universal stress UspA family protein
MKERRKMGYKKIVCGVTGSAHAQKAALEAAVIAKENSAELIYVYAVDSKFARGGIAVEVSHTFIDESLEKLGGHILDHAAEIARTQGITPKKVLKRGAVMDVLKDVVKEEGADLLMIGHEGRSFFDKFFKKGDVEDDPKELKKIAGVDVNIVG